jgi:LL-H family phage holin
MKDFWTNIINFLNEYGILSMVITAVVGAVGTALGLFFKRLYTNTIGDKIKLDTVKEIARVVVKFVEQVFKDKHGEEKMEEALKAFSEMLNNKGITISELEMRVYLESALAEFNEAFNKEINKETSEDI